MCAPSTIYPALMATIIDWGIIEFPNCPLPTINAALFPAQVSKISPFLREAMGEEEEKAVRLEGEGDGGGLTVRKAESALRLVPMGLCLAAMVVMVRNSEENEYGSISYSDLIPFTYLVYADAICAAYSLFSAFFTAVRTSSTLSKAWTIFFFDQVLTYVILAAGTVSAEIIFLAYNGDAQVTWSKECGVFNGFCNKATTSVGITFGAVACYIMLALISSYRLFSAYEAPIPFLSNKASEIAAFAR